MMRTVTRCASLLALAGCVSLELETVTRVASTTQVQDKEYDKVSTDVISYDSQLDADRLVIRGERVQHRCKLHVVSHVVDHVEIGQPVNTDKTILANVLGAAGVAVLIGGLTAPSKVAATPDNPTGDNSDFKNYATAIGGVSAALSAIMLLESQHYHSEHGIKTTLRNHPPTDAATGSEFDCGVTTVRSGLRAVVTLYQGADVIDRRALFGNGHDGLSTDYANVADAAGYCKALTMTIEDTKLQTRRLYTANTMQLDFPDRGTSTYNDVAHRCCVAALKHEYADSCRRDCMAASNTQACYSAGGACLRHAAQSNIDGAFAKQTCDQLLLDCVLARGSSFPELATCTDSCSERRTYERCASPPR